MMQGSLSLLEAGFGVRLSDDHGEGLIPGAHVSQLNRKLDLTFSEFSEFFVNILPEEPFSMSEREYLEEIYDGDSREVLMLAGRQVEKSTTLGNIAIASAILLPGARILYVSPSDRQTKTFSYERIRGTVLKSPKLREFIIPGSMSVYDQQFLTGSVVKLRSCYLTPDRLRGERADVVFVDEYQDILPENVPVIRECTFHANPLWLRFFYSGTPKTLDNSINRLWLKHSTMTELMFPCRAHGEAHKPYTWHWFPVTVDCLGKNGLICPRCGKPINHLDPKATWVDTAPQADKRKVRGYHIPQVITPMAHQVVSNERGQEIRSWDEIVTKRERYPIGKFMNEVMGESYEHGVRPVSEADLARCQVADWVMGPEQLRRMMKISSVHPVYAGIDWGGEDYAYTIIVLGTYALSPSADRFFQFYWHRFEGKESNRELQLERIYDLLRGFNVRHCVADYGMGHFQNDWLIRRLGAKRYTRLQYVGKQQGKLVWRPKLGWFTGYKSAVCSDWISAVKKGKIALPAWNTFAEPFGQDFLNVRTEYNDRRDETMYTHSAESPVDSFHAGLYCLVASLRDFPRPDITHLTVDESVADPLILEDPTGGVPYF